MEFNVWCNSSTGIYGFSASAEELVLPLLTCWNKGGKPTIQQIYNFHLGYSPVLPPSAITTTKFRRKIWNRQLRKFCTLLWLMREREEKLFPVSVSFKSLQRFYLSLKITFKSRLSLGLFDTDTTMQTQLESLLRSALRKPTCKELKRKVKLLVVFDSLWPHGL